MKKRIRVVDTEETFYQQPLEEFVQWIKRHVDAVPQEHRNALQIEISGVSGYESCASPRIEIWYEREETQREIEEREFSEVSRRLEKIQQLKKQLKELGG